MGKKKTRKRAGDKGEKDWRLYERFVASLQAEKASPELTVIPNALIMGCISGTERQIDVLLDARVADDVSRRVIVDAKRRGRRLDVTDVEQFEGLMRDVRAHRGILVCPNGYSAAALRRAQEAITIQLVGLEQLENLDLGNWDTCLQAGCSGFLLWDTTFALSINNSPMWIHAVAKCDECRRFHIWCWACAERFPLDDEDEYQCSCKEPWFWLTAIEEEEAAGVRAVYLFFVVPGDVRVVDRRPLA